MSHSSSPLAWERLGEQLTRRRVELDTRYQNRTTFSSERGIDYRLAYDIEEAKRTNFRTTTLAGIAAAYAVTLDSMYATLRGGKLEPVPAQRPGTAPPSADGTGDEAEEAEFLNLVRQAEPLDVPVLRALHRLLNPETGKPLPWPERRRLMEYRIEETARIRMEEERKARGGCA